MPDGAEGGLSHSQDARRGVRQHNETLPPAPEALPFFPRS